MRGAKEDLHLDVIADPDDRFEIEFQERQQGMVMYVHCNGQTILRVCQIRTEVNLDKIPHLKQLEEQADRGSRLEHPDTTGQ